MKIKLPSGSYECTEHGKGEMPYICCKEGMKDWQKNKEMKDLLKLVMHLGMIQKAKMRGMEGVKCSCCGEEMGEEFCKACREEAPQEYRQWLSESGYDDMIYDQMRDEQIERGDR